MAECEVLCVASLRPSSGAFGLVSHWPGISVHFDRNQQADPGCKPDTMDILGKAALDDNVPGQGWRA